MVTATFVNSKTAELAADQDPSQRPIDESRYSFLGLFSCASETLDRANPVSTEGFWKTRANRRTKVDFLAALQICYARDNGQGQTSPRPPEVASPKGAGELTAQQLTTPAHRDRLPLGVRADKWRKKSKTRRRRRHRVAAIEVGAGSANSIGSRRCTCGVKGRVSAGRGSGGRGGHFSGPSSMG